MTDYVPIDCGIYSGYELAIIQRRRLRLTWRGDDGIIHIRTVTPTDLHTRNKGEFMVVTDERGDRYNIRLDHIRRHEILQ
ncbi:MAG: transcriptional antiterminator, Rof [Gammaproteobacteria bacterium]|jgi:Rho-binding antiterminator